MPFTDAGTQAAADENKQKICAHNSYLAPWTLLVGVISRERGYTEANFLQSSR